MIEFTIKGPSAADIKRLEQQLERELKKAAEREIRRRTNTSEKDIDIEWVVE